MVVCSQHVLATARAHRDARHRRTFHGGGSTCLHSIDDRAPVPPGCGVQVRRIVLPRNDRLQGQIVGLERRTSAVGRDTISHPDRGHDDVANAVAGAAALSKFGGYDTSLRWVSGDDDSGDAWQRVRLQAFINSGGRIRL